MHSATETLVVLFERIPSANSAGLRRKLELEGAENV